MNGGWKSETFQDRFQVGMTPLVSMEKTQQLPGAVLLFLFTNKTGFVHITSPERLWMPRPFLEVFKAKLDVALGSLVWWLATLHIARGLKQDDHCGPFQLRPFYDSMI